MSYNERLRDVLAVLGIKATAHLPREGALPVHVPLRVWFPRAAWTIDVRVWIAPAFANGRRFPSGRMWKSSRHRVMCECPSCGTELSAGRLHQHLDTFACRRAFWRNGRGKSA
jgi:hypothetical protein